MIESESSPLTEMPVWFPRMTFSLMTGILSSGGSPVGITTPNCENPLIVFR